MGKRDNRKSNKRDAIDIYSAKKYKNKRKINKESIINILLIPNIIGIDINIPLKAFLEVVKIIVRVVIAKSKIDINFLELFFLFK